MFPPFFLLTFYLSPICRVSGFEGMNLAIYDSSGKYWNNSYIARSVNDTLVLICSIKVGYCNEYTPKLAWVLPASNNRALIRQFKENGSDASVRLVVDHLQESDHGQYFCVDENGSNENSSVTINLIIRRPLDCGKGVFCDAHCILERFKCDGVPDCKNGKDEFVFFCGKDACQDKIRCENGRCIPQSWCCNNSNEDCKRKWEMSKCCPKSRDGMQLDFNTISGPYHYTDLVFRNYGDSALNYLNNPQHYSDFNFLQSTVYAVFGCAILIMLIVTILVVMMQCKLQMHRNVQFPLFQRQRVYGNSTYHRPLSEEQDLMEMVRDRFNRGSRNLCQQQDRARSAGGLLVSYSLNNGVEIIGKPVEPPPYSQLAALPPPDQGPPPPYLHTTTTEEDVR